MTTLVGKLEKQVAREKSKVQYIEGVLEIALSILGKVVDDDEKDKLVDIPGVHLAILGSYAYARTQVRFSETDPEIFAEIVADTLAKGPKVAINDLIRQGLCTKPL